MCHALPHYLHNGQGNKTYQSNHNNLMLTTLTYSGPIGSSWARRTMYHNASNGRIAVELMRLTIIATDKSVIPSHYVATRDITRKKESALVICRRSSALYANPASLPIAYIFINNQRTRRAWFRHRCAFFKSSSSVAIKAAPFILYAPAKCSSCCRTREPVILYVWGRSSLWRRRRAARLGDLYRCCWPGGGVIRFVFSLREGCRFTRDRVERYRRIC
jgi:hypothetical protein